MTGRHAGQVERFAAYLGALVELREDVDAPVLVVTSAELAELVGVNATQIRRDLGTLPDVDRPGKRGTGYRCARLAEQLRHALGPDLLTVKAAAHRATVRCGHLQAARDELEGRP